MPQLDETKLEVPTGYRSSVPARYVWQLDDQTRRLFEGLHGATAEELAWQPAPGTNTLAVTRSPAKSLLVLVMVPCVGVLSTPVALPAY